MNAYIDFNDEPTFYSDFVELADADFGADVEVEPLGIKVPANAIGSEDADYLVNGPGRQADRIAEFRGWTRFSGWAEVFALASDGDIMTAAETRLVWDIL